MKTILWFLVVTLIIGGVFLTIESATSGAELAQIEKEERELGQENKQMADLLVKSSSVLSYESQVVELGFKKPDVVIYITTEEVVARLP